MVRVDFSESIKPASPATYSPDYSEDVLLKSGRVINTEDVLESGASMYYRPPRLGSVIPTNTPPGEYYICAYVYFNYDVKE